MHSGLVLGKGSWYASGGTSFVARDSLEERPGREYFKLQWRSLWGVHEWIQKRLASLESVRRAVDRSAELRRELCFDLFDAVNNCLPVLLKEGL